MTETTVAVAEEQPAAEPVPSEWPLAEEILAAHPRLHLALGGHLLISWPDDTEVAELPLAALVAPPVILRDEDQAAFAASLITIDEDIEKHRAEAVTGTAGALKRATENLWPLPARYSPLRPLPGEEARRQHQMASVTDLSRWAPGKSFSDEPDDTRFLDAFALDPEGDEDRARVPLLPDPEGEAS